ncbi:protoglobin domain-containing protein [Paraflavitalea speifideaquila]|uniref:protoglobin domain-containing protein n=1 Tax=Paraflavitalea speifideaquila TaxID=3076558 RepID=UPI0028F00CB8|nr:protoglobin domain-containing protein [Paraflavitalea speifideiaquila]
MNSTETNIKGYDYGKTMANSPVTRQDLELLKATVLFTPADEEHLRKAGEVLVDQADAIIERWYELIGSHPHLLFYFSKNNMANLEYLTSVRKRFIQWVKDLCLRPFDQTWLNYQYEIALRHHKIKRTRPMKLRPHLLSTIAISPHSYILLQLPSNHCCPTMGMRLMK